MTNAQRMLDIWVNGLETIDDLDVFAKSVNPRVRIEGFLYNERKTFIFPDGSKVLFTGNRLQVVT